MAATINDSATNEFAALAAGVVKQPEPTIQQPNFSGTGTTVNQAAVGTNPFANMNVGQQPQMQPKEQHQISNGFFEGAMEYDVPFNTASGKVQAFLQEFEKAAKEVPALQKANGEWDFLLFDGPSNQASVSAVLFCRRGGSVVTVYPMLVQDSAEPLQDLQFGFMAYGTNMQQQVSVPQLVEEILTKDDYLAHAIPAYVRKVYATKGVKEVYLVQGMNLPPELSPENKEQVSRVLFYANAACESLLFKLTNKVEPLNLASKPSDQIFKLKFDFHGGQVATGVGLPVRSDVAIKLYLEQNRSKGNQSIGQTTSRAISMVHGYMALQYSPATNAAPMMPGMPFYPGMMPTQLFQPTFIINRLDNQFGRASLESQLLALATAASLIRDNTWWRIYEPDYRNPANDGTDPRDIGNITADANLPGEELGYTQTKNNPDPNFSIPAFLMKYLHQNLIFLMDIPELGDLTYLQRAFIDAAGVTKDADTQRAAEAEILNAANTLTNGAFSRFWDGKEPIVYNHVGRIETGYYLNERGEMRDIAEIDYLRLIAVGGGNLEHARAYMDSLNPNTGDEIMRFTARKRIYDTYFTGYQLRGFARRLTINSNFLIALGAALHAVGGDIHTDYVSHQGVNVDRSYHNQVLGIPTNGISGFAQAGWAGQGGFGNGYNTGRWTNYNVPQFAAYGVNQY